ncbi:MAG TPA: XrtA system polysaccharide deacetylase [Vicinamibacterales bacterium]|nr:XrtA system polysaccharide deacetylase [Vicinamibacterales bacterium]
MSVDVEDYFQVSAFEDVVSRASWDGLESRVTRNTERVLELLAEAATRATFFVLGWVAERHPRLVRRIADAGHEVACHSHEHRLVYEMTPLEFRTDLRRAKAAIEWASGAPVFGYRAPSHSVTARSLWALDILVEEGFLYDSSIFPIYHDRYGIPDAPRHVHLIRRPAGSIWEVPASTLRWARLNVPVAGGGYFRLMPYAWTRRAIARLNAVEGRPAIVYIHPWEIDPDQPRVPAPVLTTWRHRVGLARTYGRLRRLLADFRFGPIAELLAAEGVEPAAAGALAAQP